MPPSTALPEDYERHFPKTALAHVPATGAPMGRSLTPDEYVDVTWTTSHPTDWEQATPARRRRLRLARLATEAESQGGLARIVDLAQALEVSEQTIKRDIADLRAGGTTLRTRKSS